MDKGIIVSAQQTPKISNDLPAEAGGSACG
jgi:hypothetical protein